MFGLQIQNTIQCYRKLRDMSKGSKQRPTDMKSYSSNYDKIFRNEIVLERPISETQLQEAFIEIDKKESKDVHNPKTV